MDERAAKAGGRVGTHQPTLMLTASLLKKENVELMWVANVDCTITTLDAHQLAHDLGLQVAHHFGESILRQKLQ